MAYPKEKENMEYTAYLERYDNGEEEGPRMTKDQWRKTRKDKPQEPTAEPDKYTPATILGGD